MKSKEALHWEKWNETCRKDSISGSAINVGRTVIETLDQYKIPRSSRILEVACGTGWLAHHLVTRGDYVGLDLAPSAIEIARERMPGIHFEAADFHEWQPPAETFDVIICVDAIAVFRDQEQLVAKFARLLKPSGILILTTVNPFVYARIRWVKPPAEGQARNWLSKTALHALLERHGFGIDRSWTMLPDGDMGVLRLVNGRKINKAVSWLIPQPRLERMKEKVGLGQFRVVVSRLLTSVPSAPAH
jgi:2-polyprenyl-3-methyl-5-hydroxy-6-metoxy-1,4-benzoquinol methylase